MFKIGKNNKIFITRGDTAELKITLNNITNQPIDFTEGQLLLTVGKPALYTLTAEGDTFYIDASTIPVGLHWYDVQYKCMGETSTVIKGFFEVLEDYTV